MSNSVRLPVFPLNSVLFPGGLLALKIFETRYLDMISRCLQSESGFVVSLIQSGLEVGPAPQIFQLGTVVSVIDWEQRADGLLGITIEGQERVRLAQIKVDRQVLMTAVTTRLSTEEQHELPEEFADLADLLRRILNDIGLPYRRIDEGLQDAGWVAARLVELLPLESTQKQALQVMDDPLSRLFSLRDAMKNLDIL